MEAAQLARAAGQPVQVVWDRAEEFFYSTFRPAAVVKIRSGLSGDGQDRLLEVPGMGRRQPRLLLGLRHSQPARHLGRKLAGHVQIRPACTRLAWGPGEAPSANTNTFARESHLDILAAKAGVDPVEFRLNHLTDQRLRRALETAADKFGWKPAKRAQRARRRHGLWNLQERKPHGDHGRGGRG